MSAMNRPFFSRNAKAYWIPMREAKVQYDFNNRNHESFASGSKSSMRVQVASRVLCRHRVGGPAIEVAPVTLECCFVVVVKLALC